MTSNHIKENALRFCTKYVEDRLKRIKKNIEAIQEALSSETKSSAGDKHETGRAMLQLEREKLGAQLAEAEKMKQSLAKVTLQKKLETIGLGSLVKTSKANYFLAISAGELKYDGLSVFCISVATPIGQLLLGKKIGNRVFFNKEQIEILEHN